MNADTMLNALASSPPTAAGAVIKLHAPIADAPTSDLRRFPDRQAGRSRQTIDPARGLVHDAGCKQAYGLSPTRLRQNRSEENRSDHKHHSL